MRSFLLFLVLSLLFWILLTPTPDLPDKAQMAAEWQANGCITPNDLRRRSVMVNGGAGVALDATTIATAYHVMFDEKKGQWIPQAHVRLFNGPRVTDGYAVIAEHVEHDLVVIRLKTRYLAAIPFPAFARPGQVAENDELLMQSGSPGPALSYDFTITGGYTAGIRTVPDLEHPKVKHGLISRLSLVLWGGYGPGMSGGPLFTCSGRVASLLTHSNNHDGGYGIPAVLLQSALVPLGYGHLFH